MLELDHEALHRLVLRAMGSAPKVVKPMSGGASTRRYLRVQTVDRSAVAMFVPDATPEEATTATTTQERWPFLEIQALLAEKGIRVPRVLAEDCAAGLVLLEDLSDQTLAAFIEAVPDRRADIYRMAVADLAAAQRALQTIPAGCVVARRSFDETLLRWELDHFREWGLEARGIRLTGNDRATFDAVSDRLAKRIAAWPRGFVHRDYQSKNLMVLKSDDRMELVWIDFQDALMGPRVYDLVALLQDSYQELDDAFVGARLDDFANCADLDASSREELRRQFDWMTVQRKLKDAGRFVFIDRVKKNPSFLPYVEPTLSKVDRALARLDDDPDMRELASLLSRMDGDRESLS